MTDKLTPKQQRFVEEYLLDLNGTQAAIRAGYSEKGARTEAARLLANADISQAIAEKRAELSKKTALDAEWVLRNLQRVAERAMQQEPVMEFNYQTRSMEPTGEYQFDSSGANRALELVGKHLGMFTDKHDVTLRKSISEMTDEELEAVIAEVETREGTGLLPRTAH